MKSLLVSLLALISISATASPVDDLLQRVCPNANGRIIVERKKSAIDFFEIDRRGQRPVIRANTWVNVAVGLNWYLKYYCGIHLSWNCMQASLPETLPLPSQKERHETDLSLRYCFNYCTFSYSMAFWDWERWQTEIDWLALHGINMPLAVVGTECVWRNTLLRLGYTEAQVAQFIPGPAFLAWWQMNNLEAWGGPLPLTWYSRQEALQCKILQRMREFGMEPVLPGYSGMMPSFGESANYEAETSATSGESNQSTLQLWNGFRRPAVLMPTDTLFQTMATTYYEELTRLFGTATYYSADPFHEASALPGDIDFGQSAQAILKAMKQANPKARWVIQGWTENPRPELLEAIEPADMLILDLFSECRPMWGMPSIWQREEGYGEHEWLFCLLENWGGNVGLHGRMDQLLENFSLTKSHPLAKHMRGIGLTMEGTETNPIMYELMCELPWLSDVPTKEQWVSRYEEARYGQPTHSAREAWLLLAREIYNCPRGNNQQGPHESIFCSRPSLTSFQASSWSKMQNYYDPRSSLEAASLLAQAADTLAANDNYRYDLVDITRQAVADCARIVYHRAIAAYESHLTDEFDKQSTLFLRLIDMQDSLLATRTEFRLGRWTQHARALGTTTDESDLYEWNARVQITTWGNRYCADEGGLRDYAHKEWQGLLHDFYRPRWEHYFTLLRQHPYSLLSPPPAPDWYALEEPFTLRHDNYSAQPEGDEIAVSLSVIQYLQQHVL